MSEKPDVSYAPDYRPALTLSAVLEALAFDPAKMRTDQMLQPLGGRDCVTGERIEVVHADDCRKIELEKIEQARELAEQSNELNEVVQILGRLLTGSATGIHIGHAADMARKVAAKYAQRVPSERAATEDQGASTGSRGTSGSSATESPAGQLDAHPTQTEARPTPRTDEAERLEKAGQHGRVAFTARTLEREAADLRSEREALGIVLNLCMEALPECQAWGDLPGHIAALQARLAEAERDLVYRQEKIAEQHRALAEARELLTRVGNVLETCSVDHLILTNDERDELLAAIRALTDEAKP